MKASGRMGCGLIIALIAGIAVWFVLGMPGWSVGFQDADIEAAKTSIRSQFEKRQGISVSDVELIKKSPTELTGFVTLKVSGTDSEFTKPCQATMASGGGRYVWSCR